MLKQLRRFERTSKVLILGFVALMAVSLVLFFRPNSGSTAIEPTKSSEVLANVGGDEITGRVVHVGGLASAADDTGPPAGRVGEVLISARTSQDAHGVGASRSPGCTF